MSFLIRSDSNNASIPFEYSWICLSNTFVSLVATLENCRFQKISSNVLLSASFLVLYTSCLAKNGRQAGKYTQNCSLGASFASSYVKIPIPKIRTSNTDFCLSKNQSSFKRIFLNSLYIHVESIVPTRVATSVPSSR